MRNYLQSQTKLIQDCALCILRSSDIFIYCTCISCSYQYGQINIHRYYEYYKIIQYMVARLDNKLRQIKKRKRSNDAGKERKETEREKRRRIRRKMGSQQLEIKKYAVRVKEAERETLLVIAAVIAEIHVLVHVRRQTLVYMRVCSYSKLAIAGFICLLACFK